MIRIDGGGGGIQVRFSTTICSLDAAQGGARVVALTPAVAGFCELRSRDLRSCVQRLKELLKSCLRRCSRPRELLCLPSL